MPTLDEVKAQINSLNDLLPGIGSKKEIKELPNILGQHEPILNIVQGFYSGGTGILVATDRRLIFVNKGVFSLQVEDFPYDKLSSIQYSLGILLGKITLFTSGNKAEIDNVDKQRARTFCEAVRTRLSEPKQNTSIPSVSPVADDDFISKLERLGKLRDAGVLTDDEFTSQKQRILAGS